MSKYDWKMEDWRDYYYKLMKRAEMNYQDSGMSRYEREQYKYEIIVNAMDGYIENKAIEDTEKRKRQKNIDAYCENALIHEKYTKAEVERIIGVIREF